MDLDAHLVWRFRPGLDAAALLLAALATYVALDLARRLATSRGRAAAAWLSGAALALGTLAADMDIGAGALAAASFDVVALAWVYGALAVLLGAAIGRRAIAGGIAAALAVLAYVLHALAPLVDALEPLRPYSPWYHYADSAPLTTGLHALNVGVFLGITALLVLIAPFPLRRRDVGV